MGKFAMSTVEGTAMKHFGLAFGLLVSLLISSAIAQESIRLVNGEWEPYMSKSLKHGGLVSHIVSESFRLEGITVEWGWFPWKRGGTLVRKGEWDGGAVWSDAEERRQYFWFSDPVIDGNTVFFHLKSFDFDWNTIEDLMELRIGGTLEYAYGFEFDKAEQTGKLKVQRTTKDEYNLAKLLRGRIDIFPLELEIGYDMLLRLYSAETVDLLTHHPKPIKTIPYRVIFSKKIERNRHMIKLFNSGLRRLKESGKYDEFIAASRRGEYESD